MTPLRKRMLEEMQIRNLAPGTQAVYLFQVAKFARHFGKPPDVLGWEQIRAYQLYLTQEKKLASPSITVAVSALRFLYKVTLHREWNFDEIIPLPRRPSNCLSSSVRRKSWSFSPASQRANTALS